MVRKAFVTGVVLLVIFAIGAYLIIQFGISAPVDAVASSDGTLGFAETRNVYMDWGTICLVAMGLGVLLIRPRRRVVHSMRALEKN